MSTLSIVRVASYLPRPGEDALTCAAAFREMALAPALAGGGWVEIRLDCGDGYASSFLDEVFGGLIRINGLDPDDVLRRMKLVSDEDPTLIHEIRFYVEEAEREMI